MNKPIAFFSWISNSDIVEYIRTLDEADYNKFLTLSQNDVPMKRALDNTRPNPSAIRVMLSHFSKEVDHFFLVTNQYYSFLERTGGHSYKDYLKGCIPELKGEIEIISEKLDITSLDAVYTKTQEIIQRIISMGCGALYCNITGAAIITSSLVIQVTAYFDEYKLCQADGETVKETKFPESFATLISKRTTSLVQKLPFPIIGNSPTIKDITEKAHHLAHYNCNILILGPSGTGKSTLAREIHSVGPRSEKKFIEVNCGGLTPTLLQSTLFGHKKGSFSGALDDKNGAFTEADGGTLFLDEVADCPPELQTLLLGALQPHANETETTRHFEVLGDTKLTQADVRIIAATNKNLPQLIKEGKFREDLYWRLAKTTIKMPFLADIKSDITLIAEHRLQTINEENKNVPGFHPKILTEAAKSKLKEHNWPGNVRELYTVLEQSAIFSSGDKIDVKDLIFDETLPECDIPPSPEEFSIETIKRELERRYIELALHTTGGNKSQASRLLGMRTPQNLESRLKALNRRIADGVK